MLPTTAELDAVEADDRAGVMVLTGAGEAFSAGMDLKEYFRETEEKGEAGTQPLRMVRPRLTRESKRLDNARCWY